MFNALDYFVELTGGWAHAAGFSVPPIPNIVNQSVCEYFGRSSLDIPSGQMNYVLEGRADDVFERIVLAWSSEEAVVIWKIELKGRRQPPRPRQDPVRRIELAFDCDARDGERTEPYYFIARIEKGADAFTTSVAQGLVEFVARELEGMIVAIKP